MMTSQMLFFAASAALAAPLMRSISPIPFADTVLNRVTPRAGTVSSNWVPSFWLPIVVLSDYRATISIASPTVVSTVVVAITGTGSAIIATAIVLR